MAKEMDESGGVVEEELANEGDMIEDIETSI